MNVFGQISLKDHFVQFHLEFFNNFFAWALDYLPIDFSSRGFCGLCRTFRKKNRVQYRHSFLKPYDLGFFHFSDNVDAVFKVVRKINQDVILENGDIIVIPKVPRVVTITGRVGKPGGVTFSPSAKLEYYLAKSGGASWDADVRKTKVIKVSGEVLDDEDVKTFQPGDIIWVPRKSDKKFWPVFLQVVSVTAQLASIYLIIDTANNR